MNKDGVIDKSELKGLLKAAFGEEVPEEMLDAYFGMVDANDDGKISLEEFLSSENLNGWVENEIIYTNILRRL